MDMKYNKIYRVIFESPKKIDRFIKDHGKAIYLRVLHTRLETYAKHLHDIKKYNRSINGQKMS